MKKSTLRATAALQALALLGAGAGAAFIAAPAAAQDYTSGVITGTVTDESGNPVSGATVTLTSKAQGFTRTATSGGNGTFRFNGLPNGDYNVAVEAANNAGFQATDVRVLAGQTANLSIQLAAAGGEDIVVTGAQIQSFEGTTTGLNVDVEELKKTVPLGRSLTSVVLLAPGTTQGDAAFGNLASVGGGSVAENAYYVNGLNTTNFDNYLGSATVPFDMYKSVEVKSGGYPAEFGRATGGIINATTKSGSNDFKAALHLNWAPNFLQAHGRDIYSCSDVGDGTTPVIGCEAVTNRHYDYSKSLSAIAEVGGPIFRDRLFAYGLLEMRNNDTRTISRASDTAIRRTSNDPFWGFKIDAYPLDDHHLEFTMFNTRQTTRRDDLAYAEDASGNVTYGNAKSVTNFEAGGTNYVGKYTGRFTDWLTLSAAYGRMRDRFDYYGVAGAAALPAVRNLSPGTLFGVPRGGYYGPQNVIGNSQPYDTERKFYRGDADLYVNLVGDHHFRGGIDVEKNTLVESAIRNGGQYEFDNGLLTPEAYNYRGNGGGYYFRVISASVVQLDYFNSGGGFGAKNTAYYLEDEWKPTDRLTLNLGVRRDDFAVDKADGSNLVTQDKNYAPRIGVTYDLWADKRGKLKAFYGQYYLPFASNTAFRMAGSEVYFRERWNYSTLDPVTGLPNLTTQVTTNSSYQSICPFGLTPASSGNNCAVTGDGSVADTTTQIDAGLKATKEQEWIFGYEHKLGRWNLGVNFTRRKLLNTAEDTAIDAAVNNYCDENGLDCTTPTFGYDIWTGFHQYVIINPGNPITVRLDGICDAAHEGTCDTVTFTADELGLPKASRKYTAVEFTFERPSDGVWNLGGSYTWSKSKGNSEGFVQSDFGQDDAGITQDFDQPGFIPGSYGYLPNDRRHRFKLFGSYTFDDKFTIGGNYQLNSPRPLSCFGFNPTDDYANVYGAASHYCGGKLSPRGTAQKSGWISQLDLKGAYKIAIPTGQMLTLRADVFNVLNAKGIQARDEIGDSDFSGPVGPTRTYAPNYSFGQPTVYQSPRSVRLGMDIEF